jgi:hypothetical protein
MEQTLYLTLKKNNLHHFFPLLQEGVIIKILAGVTINDFLTLQLGITPEYVENRIQTIFLDGKAVDDLREVFVRDGSMLALSAAMPGLVGATLRRGGAFASLRQAITFSEDGQAIPQKGGWIVLKLFNLLVPELGPHILAKGVWLKGEDLNRFLVGLKKDFWEDCREVVKNDQIIKAALDMIPLKFENGTLVLLKVISHPK